MISFAMLPSLQPIGCRLQTGANLEDERNFAVPTFATKLFLRVSALAQGEERVFDRPAVVRQVGGKDRNTTQRSRGAMRLKARLTSFAETARDLSILRITDGIAAERQIKGWSRAKKGALIRSDWAKVSQVSRRRAGLPRQRGT
jgi:hypothetical protein